MWQTKNGVACNYVWAHLLGNLLANYQLIVCTVWKFWKINLTFNWHENCTWIMCAFAMPIITFNRTVINSYVEILWLKDFASWFSRDYDSLDFTIKNHLVEPIFLVKYYRSIQKSIWITNEKKRKQITLWSLQQQSGEIEFSHRIFRRQANDLRCACA